MPPVVAALPIIASIAVAVLEVSAIVKALILIAAVVATKLLTKKPKGNRLNQGQELRTRIIPDHPRQVLVGQIATGGSIHFAHTYTNDSSKPNRYLLRVIQLSDQPVNSIISIRDGKTVLTFSGDVTTGYRTCTNAFKTKSGSPCMEIRVYLGSMSPTADATLISRSGGLWTANHKGRGLAYAIVRYDYDQDAFPAGEPELVFEVQGAKVYDDRFDSTVPGGSGTQRLNDYSTWQYNTLTSVIIAQYLRGFLINGKRIIGVGCDARDLDPAMLFSAHNTCAQNVAHLSGTEARYQAGMVISSDENAETHLVDLMAAMDGQIFDRGGYITLLPGAVRTPVMNLAEQDFDWTAEKSWQPKPPLDVLVNYVSGNFIDSERFYQEGDIPPRQNAQWELDDGGQRFSEFISLRAVTRRSQAQRLAKRLHDASRFAGVVALVGGIWLLELEQGDWFTLTASRWQFASKYFEVHDITLTTDMRVAIVARETTTALDSWAPASDEFARSDSQWTPPAYALPVPTFSLTQYNFYDASSGTQDFGLNITLTNVMTNSHVVGIEVEYALTSDLANPKVAPSITPDQLGTRIVGLLPATSYSVRLRSTDGTAKSAWSSWSALATPSSNTTIVSDIDALEGELDVLTGELDTISNDEVLTVTEKQNVLMRISLDLESHYTDLKARADTMGLSSSGLVTARTNWQLMLDSFTPAWNDVSQNTTIYDHLFADRNFPAGWSNNFVSTSASGIYTVVTDNNASNLGSINRGAGASPSTQYSVGLLVKKDAVSAATRHISLTIWGTGGTFTSAQILVDTSNGANSPAGLDASGVIDLGSEWLVWASFTTHSTNNTLTYNLYPAHATGLNGIPVASLTGSVSVRSPLVVQGDWKKLGREMLRGRLALFTAEITKLAKSISERDGTTGLVINQQPDVTVYADHLGTVKAGELPREVSMTASVGTANVTTLGVWSLGTLTGVTATIGASTGLISITALASLEAEIGITFVYSGVTRTSKVKVVRRDDLPPIPEGGGGSGATYAQTTVLANSTSGYSTGVSDTLTVTPDASGQVDLSAPISFLRPAANGIGTTTAWGKWQWRPVGGSFADVAAEVQASTGAARWRENVGTPSEPVWEYHSTPGQINVEQSKTGLTPGTDYEFRFIWRHVNTSGTTSHVYRTGGTMSSEVI